MVAGSTSPRPFSKISARAGDGPTFRQPKHLAPTDEQHAAITSFGLGQPLKIAAFAGTGKTTTLRLLAMSRSARGVYLAFNRAIADDARRSFPPAVDCRTTHALAYRAVAPTFGSSDKLSGRMLAKQLAEMLGYRDHDVRGAVHLRAVQQAHLVERTVRRFCQSGAPTLAAPHVPIRGRIINLDGASQDAVRDWALSEAGRLWRRMNDPQDAIPLGHDGYLKRWALTAPRLPAEYILLDEAQDANGAILGVLANQAAQIVYVGDRHQQIYAWRGAVNAMDAIAGCLEAPLTQSFRFGRAVAAVASDVLAQLRETRPVRGNPSRPSSVAATGCARAVLTRTNAGLIAEVLAALARDQTICVTGGAADLRRLLHDVFELKSGGTALSPELFGFTDWSEVVTFAETDEGEELRSFVQLVERHGERKLWRIVKSLATDERRANVVLSTAHKAKGREWDSVRLSGDFGGKRLADPVDAASERRLFYVAMTRARATLIVAPDLLSRFTEAASEAA